jgi:Recombination directionality factor-like
LPSLSRADDRTPAGSSATNRVAAEPIGRLGFGLLRNGRPETLTTWRISARDPEVVARVAALFRGMPRKSTDADEYEWHVVTETATVVVILSGPHALHVCWRRDGFGRRCGGSEQGRAARCACSLRSLAERKAAARRGHGCVPNIEMSFQLVDDPTLGVFKFVSGNWSFAEQAVVTEAVLGNLAVPTLIQLGLKQTHHILRGGRSVTYTRPTLAVLGPSSLNSLAVTSRLPWPAPTVASLPSQAGG